MNDSHYHELLSAWRSLKLRGLTTLDFADYVKAQMKEPKVADILYARHAKEFQGFENAKRVACVVVSGAPKRAA